MKRAKALLNCLLFACVILLTVRFSIIRKRRSNDRYDQTDFIRLNESQQDFSEIRKSFYWSNICEYVPSALIGKQNIRKAPLQLEPFGSSIDKIKRMSFKHNLDFLKNLKNGGNWKPINCVARHKVAIVIPYRNRLDNLRTFLYNMHPFMQRQEIQYTIFVVEQVGYEEFNKGILMNAAFLEIFNKTNIDSLKDAKYDCIIYHDADLIPTDDLNLYTCPEKPKHYSIVVGNVDYRNSYPILVGGVMNFKPTHFIKVNGYSNLFWGWGGEDDDMYYRLTRSKLGFTRPVKNTKYEMLEHQSWKRNMERFSILDTAFSRINSDGISTVKYKLKGIIKYPLLTHIMVDVGKPFNNKTLTSTFKSQITTNKFKKNKIISRNS